ncbi:Calcitonin gene-related peptide type 1 receptor [Melipona quadrifasciata]|uniref:Calcitonin gene-related peptide type 1 receptor n=1 Tax=Melipona quadrifasciata TaxID=166423 RepID=A0A0M8ZP15_9HYME|nr:Calcitonin gene-related peptide type 1 receptor [Melipona quadrifasciata]
MKKEGIKSHEYQQNTYFFDMYSITRYVGEFGYLKRCWINEGNYMNVLIYPVCVSTLLNVLFLFNIVRVLLMKLRAGPTIGTQPSRSMRQAFRATLLLVPLLGLHYLVIPFRPPKNHPWEQFYEVLSAITASFQGLCVAILFCFCNGEVIAQFKRKWEGTVFLRNRANSCTATTVSNPPIPRQRQHQAHNIKLLDKSTTKTISGLISSLLHLTFTQHTRNHIVTCHRQFTKISTCAYHAAGIPPRVTVALHGRFKAKRKKKKGAEKYWNARLVNVTENAEAGTWVLSSEDQRRSEDQRVLFYVEYRELMDYLYISFLVRSHMKILLN